MAFIEKKLELNRFGVDHNKKFISQNNYLETCTFTHCNKSCNYEWCGNKMHQNVANMMLSQYLELKLSLLRRTTVSGHLVFISDMGPNISKLLEPLFH